MKSAYDKKNEDDFEQNTNLLFDSIDNIERNKNLKPTISELSKLTGLHRNTIRDREWPIERLKEIKDKRKTSIKKDVVSKQSQLRIVVDKLDKAQKELVYWYRLSQEKESAYQQLDINYERMTDSKNMYEGLLEAERKNTLELEKQISLLKQLIEK